MEIKINITKKHFWAIILVIVILFGVMIVVAKTTTPTYQDDQPFHEPLYTDTIAGKSADEVTVDDKLLVDTIAGNTNKVTIDDDLEVTGDLRYNNAIVGGCSDACTLDSSGLYSCGGEWGKGRCGGSLANAVGIGGCTAQGGTSCGCDEGHKVVISGMQCWTVNAGFSSTCYISICVYP